MDINFLTSGERETLMFEVLMKLRTCIPNVTRPSGILMNQNQPMTVEESGDGFKVTANVRAVDFTGKYLFLGPYFLNAKKNGSGWEVSDPTFDCGVDGCYYDILGLEDSHLKFYKNMVTINEKAVMFEECEGATMREPTDEQPGVVIYHMKDGTFTPFYWDNTIQNTPFMYRLIEISDLLISKIAAEQKAAEEKAAKLAARAAARPDFAKRNAASAGTAAGASASDESGTDTAARPRSPFSSRTMDPIIDEQSDRVEKPHAYGQTLASLRAGRDNAPEPAAAPVAAPAAKPAEEAQPDSPFLPDTRAKRPEPQPQKSPFKPLKNVTPEMEKPKPSEGPAIIDTYVPEWGSKPLPVAPKEDGEPKIKPMTAESLSHLDDWKPYKSRVVISPEEEVEKYRRLLSIGAITQDEFEIKKNQLLGE